MFSELVSFISSDAVRQSLKSLVSPPLPLKIGNKNRFYVFWVSPTQPPLPPHPVSATAMMQSLDIAIQKLHPFHAHAWTLERGAA